MLGVATGDSLQEFTRLAGAKYVASSRAVVVADRQAPAIRVFSVGGDHLRSFGRRGRGPAELLSADKMFLNADTVIVVD